MSLFIDIIVTAIKAVAISLVITVFALFGGVFERKIIGRVHSRYGPTETGKFGLLQTLADVIKFLGKEIIFPEKADKLIYRLAPILMVVAGFVPFAVLPMGRFTVLNLDYSLIFLFAVLSLVPIGLLLAGWASNSKYAMMGGIRAAGLMVAYELLGIFSLAGLIILTKSFNINTMVAFQHEHLWFVLLQPLAFLLFAFSLIAMTERNPFDIAEAESEIVAGVSTEYGGAYFALFFLAQYSVLLIGAVILASLFFGGWLGFLGDFGFWLKVCIITFILFVVRATFFRYRLDQLLRYTWRVLMPLAMLNIIFTLIEVKLLL